MDSTVAALLGAVIGGVLSVVASWVAQYIQSRSQWLSQEVQRRQQLYSEFLETASSCFADALQEHDPDRGMVGKLYGEIGRMRLQSSELVVKEATDVARVIMATYAAENRTAQEITALTADDSFDPFCDFSNACRAELVALRPIRTH
jgi:hypothetical protein